jgi:Zn-dependent protease with chaperone function
MASPAGAGAASVGPVDRVAFFDEQRRNRRATWRLAAAAALGVTLMGIPVSIVVTPVVYGVLLVCGHVINLFYPFPATVTHQLVSIIGFVSSTIDSLTGNTRATPPSVPALLVLAAVLELPGVVAMIASWLGVHGLLRRAGVGGMLLSLGARPPQLNDLKERELQNAVEEMAIAAGLAPPRVALLDSGAANAAMIGTSEADATVVVSRGLLDDLNRSEIQAVVGHLIGSMGNGDLKIAFTLVSVFEACGLLVTILDAPFGPIARGNLRRLARLAVHRREATATAEADLVGSILAGTVALEGNDDVLGSRQDPPIVLLPLVMINVAAKWTLFIFTSVVVGPMLALLWRARRYLADATAVQLTRNPDALADALAHLMRDGGMVFGGQSATYLFIVGQTSARHAGDSGQKDRLGTNSLVAFHPPLKRRLERLRALGARADVVPGDAARPARTPAARAIYAFAILFVGALGALALAAAFAAVGILVMVSMFFAVLALLAIHAVFLLVGYIKTLVGR